jgi:hypothetical protein
MTTTYAPKRTTTHGHTVLWIIPGGDHVPIYDSTVPFTATALRFLDGSDSK